MNVVTVEGPLMNQSKVEVFGEDYFMNGVREHLSNFENYRWMPDATISLAQHVKRYLALKDGDTFLDVGAARGFLVKALRMLGIDAHGYDISEWAINHCDPEVRAYMSNYLNGAQYDVVWSKDCFEHVPREELTNLVKKLALITRRRMFFIIPLAEVTDGPFVHPKEENDRTHVNRCTLPDWLTFFQDCSSSFVVSGSYRYPGLKPGCYEVESGYGFFNLERI